LATLNHIAALTANSAANMAMVDFFAPNLSPSQPPSVRPRIPATNCARPTTLVTRTSLQPTLPVPISGVTR
jgi:hypothetical protein